MILLSGSLLSDSLVKPRLVLRWLSFEVRLQDRFVKVLLLKHAVDWRDYLAD